MAALLIEILRSLWRGEVGLDIVAALSMSAALAFGETLSAILAVPVALVAGLSRAARLGVLIKGAGPLECRVGQKAEKVGSQLLSLRQFNIRHVPRYSRNQRM